MNRLSVGVDRDRRRDYITSRRRAVIATMLTLVVMSAPMFEPQSMDLYTGTERLDWKRSRFHIASS